MTLILRLKTSKQTVIASDCQINDKTGLPFLDKETRSPICKSKLEATPKGLIIGMAGALSCPKFKYYDFIRNLLAKKPNLDISDLITEIEHQLTKVNNIHFKAERTIFTVFDKKTWINSFIVIQNGKCQLRAVPNNKDTMANFDLYSSDHPSLVYCLIVIAIKEVGMSIDEVNLANIDTIKELISKVYSLIQEHKRI